MNKNLKHSILAIIAGGLTAVVSCSAIKMSSKDIIIQSTDTLTHKFTPPSVPAMVVMPAIRVRFEGSKPNHQAFKDSLVFGMKSIMQGINQINQKIDSGLTRQTTYISNQYHLMNMVDDLRQQNVQLKHDNAQAKKVSTEVKNDALVGNTFQQFGLYLLIFIAVFVLGTFLLVLALTFSHRKPIKKQLC